MREAAKVATHTLGLCLILSIPSTGSVAAQGLAVLDELSSLVAGTELFGELEDASIFLVQNTTDDDIQAVITAEGGESAIARLLVFGPQGLLPVNARFRDGDSLGIADFRLDSPEPPGFDIRRAYPEGEYTFVAFTVERTLLVSDAELSFELLPAPVVTFPLAGQEDVPIQGLTVTWEPIEDAEAIVLEVEDEEQETTLSVDLPADATEFELPPAWLEGGVEYVIDLEAEAENGNVTVTDLRFTTAE